METYVEGMLDRDQRTAKLRFFHDDVHMRPTTGPCHEPQESVDGVEERLKCCRPTRTRRSSGKSSHLACRNGYLLNTFQSVKSVLLVVCITLVTVPLVSSAPTKNMANNIPFLEQLKEKHMRWTDPCASSINVSNNSIVFYKQDLQPLVTVNSEALTLTEEIWSKHTERTFQKSLKEVLDDNIKLANMDWLGTELPKKLKEPLPDNYFEQILIEDELRNIYSLLQRIAVGLEQMVLNQNDTNIVEDFKKLEDKLMSLLCELHQTIKGNGYSLPTDVTRVIMPEDQRQGDDVAIRTRDFIILKRYIITLEYTSAALAYYYDKAPNEPKKS